MARARCTCEGEATQGAMNVMAAGWRGKAWGHLILLFTVNATAEGGLKRQGQYEATIQWRVQMLQHDLVYNRASYTVSPAEKHVLTQTGSTTRLVT